MQLRELKKILEKKVGEYNRPSFIENDPIQIPHRFSKKEDIEIAAFFAAIFAWGNRKIIISKTNALMALMQQSPYEFIMQASKKEIAQLQFFKHRTFNGDDILFFISFLKAHYKKHKSLEDAFFIHEKLFPSENKMYSYLAAFHHYVFSFPHLARSEKHISTPLKNAACKRINMYLRWMVRKDKQHVDFGIWKKIKTEDLIIPMDIHVTKVAYNLGLIPNEKANWKNAVILSNILKKINPQDPLVYDYALFGMGLEKRIHPKSG